MREPSIKWVMIAVIVGLTIFVLSYNTQVALYANNPSTSNISASYLEKYEYLVEQQSQYSSWGDTLDIRTAWSLASDAVNTFASSIVMGLSALTNLVRTMSGLREILTELGKDPALSQFYIIFGLLVTVFMIWLTYRALSEARGTTQS
jgi:quinol-cytochrome oxidoreductase complex cytochrome b subunit